MITRRNFIVKAAVGAAGLLGLATSQRVNQPTASAQIGPDTARPIKPTAAGAGDVHRVEAKVEGVKPEPWTIRTYRYVASKRAFLEAGVQLSDAMLRSLGVVPSGDPMPRDQRVVLRKHLQLEIADTVDFKVDRSMLRYPLEPQNYSLTLNVQ